MKTVWMASVAIAAAVPLAHAQSTIYKHVDESGRITYSNMPGPRDRRRGVQWPAPDR